MKKICICTTVPSTIRAFILDSVRYIHENTDWDISFICDYDEDFEKSLPDYIHYYPVKMERGVSLSGLKAIREFKKIFKREKFDLVQYSTPNAAFYASIAAKRTGIKIRNYHLMGLKYEGFSGLSRRIFRMIEKIACSKSTSIECVSKSNLEIALKDNLFDRDKATVVWNGSTGGVNLHRFNYDKRTKWRNEVREGLGIDKNDFLFGFIGRITRDKGLNELLQAFQEIKKDCKLLIVGPFETDNDSETNTAIQNARQDKRIIFHDTVNQIEKYYAALDVLLLPSYREGFGNVVIEAGAMGTPAIVSNIPGPIDAVVPDVTAKLVDVKNSTELKDAMLEIMSSDYVKMGISAKDYVTSHFDSEELNRHILERKKELLGYYEV